VPTPVFTNIETAPSLPNEEPTRWCLGIPAPGGPGRTRSAVLRVEAVRKANPELPDDEVERRALADLGTPPAFLRLADDPITEMVPIATRTRAKEGASGSALPGYSGASGAGTGVEVVEMGQSWPHSNFTLARPERVRGGVVVPPDEPSWFSSVEEAQAACDRYLRIGQELDLPGWSRLRHAQVYSNVEHRVATRSLKSDVNEAAARQKFEQAQREAEAAVAKAKEAAAALNGAPALPEPGKVIASIGKPTDSWTNVPGDANGLQHRARKDGTVFYRRRVGSAVSEGFTDRAVAEAWTPEGVSV
jgi:hypothetical protein